MNNTNNAIPYAKNCPLCSPNNVVVKAGKKIITILVGLRKAIELSINAHAIQRKDDLPVVKVLEDERSKKVLCR